MTMLEIKSSLSIPTFITIAECVLSLVLLKLEGRECISDEILHEVRETIVLITLIGRLVYF